MSHIFSALKLEDAPAYVEELEKKYGIELPPVFKAFVKTFKFGEFNPKPKHKIRHENSYIGYEYFNSSLEKAIQVYYDQGEIYTEPQLLPIIISGYYHQGICLGIGKDNADKILLVEDFDEFTFVAENILEFISGLKEIHWDSLS